MIPELLLKQYATALVRNRDVASPADKTAYDAELARLKTSPSIPVADELSAPKGLKDLRDILRRELVKQK